MMNRAGITRRRLLPLLLAPLAGVRPASAQDFPSRPIRLIVPWPPGGVTDLAARVVAQQLAERLSATVVVDNRAGAAGVIGAQAAARAAPDGYTLLLASAETHAIAPNLRDTLPYDPLKDFSAVAPFAINPFSLVARGDFPAASTQDLVAAVAAAPGKFTYSSAGLGSASQIAMETFKGLAKLDILHVPFPGQAPALASLTSGQTDLQMLPAGSAASLREGGRIKVFAVTTANRFFGMPDIPSLREEGFAPMDFANTFGLVAPAGTPAEAVQRLSAAMAAVVTSAEAEAALRRIGLEVFAPMSPADFQRFLEAELPRWGQVIRAANIRPD
jgi:tripartite-type tricarboxylate transporter receptor subunit TctC